MLVKKQPTLWLLILAMITLPTLSLANEAANEGRIIMQRFTQQDNGFGDFRGDVTMIIRENNGKEFERHMEVRILEDGDSGEKRLFVFDKPRTINGTALLSHTMDKNESQWIYLPAFKRIKRISSNNKSSAFVSSEFSYEDLSSVELEKYRYQYLKEEVVDGNTCYLVKMTPLLKGSGYQFQIAYIDKTDYIFRQVDYFDKKGTALKTLKLHDYQQYLNRFWRPLTLTMVNHQNGRATTMRWSNIVYANGFSEHEFDSNALKHSR